MAATSRRCKRTISNASLMAKQPNRTEFIDAEQDLRLPLHGRCGRLYAWITIGIDMRNRPNSRGRAPGWLALSLVTFLAGCAGSGSGEPPSIILISIDTLRADHLGCYGYDRPTSPALDALAARGAGLSDGSSTSARLARSGPNAEANNRCGFAILGQLLSDAGRSELRTITTVVSSAGTKSFSALGSSVANPTGTKSASNSVLSFESLSDVWKGRGHPTA